MDSEPGPMERFVTVGEFTVPFEAELARARLEDEGFKVIVMGGMAATTLSGFGSVGGSIQVQVPAHTAQRATEILISCSEATIDDDWEDRAERQDDLWVCTLCGEA